MDIFDFYYSTFIYQISMYTIIGNFINRVDRNLIFLI